MAGLLVPSASRESKHTRKNRAGDSSHRKGCYINQAGMIRTIGRGSQNLYKKDPSRVSRLGAEPNDLRPSFELT